MAFPVTVYLLNSNSDPGTSGLNFEQLSTNPCNTRAVLPPVGTTGAKHVFARRFTSAQIVGSRAAETDDNYRASTAGSPADLLWLAMGVDTHSGTNLLTAAGVYVQLTIELDIRFYGRVEQTF